MGLRRQFCLVINPEVEVQQRVLTADLRQQHRGYTCIFFLVVLNFVFRYCFEGKCFLTKLSKFWEVLKTSINVFGATFPKLISVPLGFVFLPPSLPLMPFVSFLFLNNHPLSPCFIPFLSRPFSPSFLPFPFEN